MKNVTLVFSVVAVLAGVWSFDLWAGREISLWFLYVLPIMASTFARGLSVGLTVSLASVGLLAYNGYHLGNPFSSLAPYVVDLGSEALTFVLIAVLTSLARRQYLAFKNELRDAPALPD